MNTSEYIHEQIPILQIILNTISPIDIQCQSN